MRIQKDWIKDCIIIEEGNEKMTLFHWDFVIAHVVGGVCLTHPSCFKEGNSAKEAFDSFITFIRRRSMFGHKGIIHESDLVQHRLTITIGN